MSEEFTTIYEVLGNDTYKNHFFSSTSLEAARQFAKDAVDAWEGQMHFNIYQVAVYDKYRHDMPVVCRGKLETI